MLLVPHSLGDPGEAHAPTAALLALPFAARAIPEAEKTVSVEIIILIIVLLLLFGGGGFYVEVLQVWRFDLISWADAPRPIDFRTVQVAPV
jgi:hypothetical protein